VLNIEPDGRGATKKRFSNTTTVIGLDLWPVSRPVHERMEVFV